MNQTTFLLSTARFSSAIARLCLGPLLPLLTLSLGFDEASKPALLSAYSSGYILTQIAGGYLADKYGFAQVISSTVGISAIILFYISTVATTSLQWTRAFFIMGMVAGPLFPAGSSAISCNVQPEKRAAAAAVVDAAASAGTCVAALTPLIASYLGWRAVFQLTGVGLAIVAFAVWTTFPKPASSTRKFIASSMEDNINNKKGDWTASIAVAFQANAILTYCCHSADNFSKYSINAYAATMLVSKHSSSQALVGTILGTQEAVGVISKILVGSFAPSSAPSLSYRGLASGIGFFVQAICLWAAFQASSEYKAGTYLVLSAIAVGSHSIGFRPIYLEASPENAGSLSGMGNTIASLASALGPLAIGSFIEEDAGDWSHVALSMLLVNIGGCMAGLTIALLAQAEWQWSISSLHRE